MSRRSRRRQSAGLRLPLIAFVALLLVGAGAWWWSQRDDAPDAATAVDAPRAGDPQRIKETLSLPPVEDTRPGGLAGDVPMPPASAPAPRALPAFLPPEARRVWQCIAHSASLTQEELEAEAAEMDAEEAKSKRPRLRVIAGTAA